MGGKSAKGWTGNRVSNGKPAPSDLPDNAPMFAEGGAAVFVRGRLQTGEKRVFNFFEVYANLKYILQWSGDVHILAAGTARCQENPRGWESGFPQLRYVAQHPEKSRPLNRESPGRVTKTCNAISTHLNGMSSDPLPSPSQNCPGKGLQ